jgi:hypothetical protein
MNPTDNLNNESFHYANGKMRIQRLSPEEIDLKLDGNRHSGDRLPKCDTWLTGAKGLWATGLGPERLFRPDFYQQINLTKSSKENYTPCEASF